MVLVSHDRTAGTSDGVTGAVSGKSQCGNIQQAVPRWQI